MLPERDFFEDSESRDIGTRSRSKTAEQKNQQRPGDAVFPYLKQVYLCETVGVLQGFMTIRAQLDDDRVKPGLRE